MLITHATGRRLAAAALCSTVLLTGFAAAPAFAIDRTGEVTVQDPDSVTDTPEMQPRIDGCRAVIELRGYGGVTDGGEDVGIAFETQGGRGGQISGVTVAAVPGEPITVTADTSGSELNGSKTYTLVPDPGQVVTQVKVTAYSGSAEIGTKVFRVDNCSVPDGGDDGDNGNGDNGNGENGNGENGNGENGSNDKPTTKPEHPKKVNSGGEADASGLVFLGVAGAALLGAAGYGLNRSRRRN